jgi:hypothetical protein
MHVFPTPGEYAFYAIFASLSLSRKNASWSKNPPSRDKHQKGEKVIAITDNHGSVLAPVPVAPVNETDMILFPEGLKALKQVAKEVGLDLRGAYLNLDGGFDSAHNRKCIFNAGMIPEGVSELLISYQTDTPNLYRLIKRPITTSCRRAILAKQSVRRTHRCIRVRRWRCLLSLCGVFACPTVGGSASPCRS